MTAPPRGLAISWVGLILLVCLTLGLSYVPLGSANIAAALGIAALKAAIVVIVFMKLLHGPSLTWLFAAAGLFWLLIMFGLAGIDYAARLWVIAS